MDEVLFFDENNFDILDIDGYELNVLTPKS